MSLRLVSRSRASHLNSGLFFKRDLRFCDKSFSSPSFGFTLIETLIVILVVGIICATGVSMYAGVTQDTQFTTASDSLRSFFKACQHRAQLRRTPVRVHFNDGLLSTPQSSALKLRIPELSKDTGEMIDGMLVGHKQTVLANGESIKQLDIGLILPGNKAATFTLEIY